MFWGFYIGKFNDKKSEFVFNREKIINLRSRQVNLIYNCKDCFAKYNCSGECLAKTFANSGDMYDTTKNNRCLINRGLLIEETHDKVKNNPISWIDVWVHSSLLIVLMLAKSR